jgi:DNA-binding HxlR family transcriptional regulator
LPTLLTPCGGPVGILSVHVAELRAEGLVSEEIENKFQDRRLISLTEKGKRVAELMKKIKKP